MKRLALTLALLAAPVVAAPAPHEHGGSVATVAGPAHASDYAEGLYLLHSFEYDRAAVA